MYDFNFQSASSIDDAAAKLSAAEDGTVMAGGQTLIPVLKQRLASPSDVISLAGAGLSGITNNGDSVTIGATTSHAEVAASSDVPAVLRSVAEGIGDAQVRNRGTIGGAIGSAVMSTIVTARTDASGLPLEAGYVLGFSVLAAMMLVAASAGLLIPGLVDRERSRAAVAEPAPA